MRISIALLAFVLALNMASLSQAHAQSGEEKTTGTPGLRVGFGIDPTQFVFGGEYAIGKRLGLLKIVPSVDVGLGDNITTFLFNADLQIGLNVEGTRFRLYGGGGPALAYLNPDGRGSDWELGLNLVAGTTVPLMKKQTTRVEVRFGITDRMPDFRALFVIEF